MKKSYLLIGILCISMSIPTNVNAETYQNSKDVIYDFVNSVQQ